MERVLAKLTSFLTFATLMDPSNSRSTSSANASHVGASLMHHTHHGAYCKIDRPCRKRQRQVPQHHTAPNHPKANRGMPWRTVEWVDKWKQQSGRGGEERGRGVKDRGDGDSGALVAKLLFGCVLSLNLSNILQDTKCTRRQQHFHSIQVHSGEPFRLVSASTVVPQIRREEGMPPNLERDDPHGRATSAREKLPLPHSPPLRPLKNQPGRETHSLTLLQRHSRSPP